MNILVASPISSNTIEKLREQHDLICAFNENDSLLKGLLQDREILIFRSGVRITAEIMENAPDLKLLVRAGSGTDNVDLDYVQRRGISFFRIAEPGAQAVAEMSFALMLALARNLVQANDLTRQGRWAKQMLIGSSLRGKVLGIVGAGNIGSRVGQLGAAWGMEPLGCVEHASRTVADDLHCKGIRLTDFDEVVCRADFLSVHVPLKNSTRNLINDKVLSRVKDGSFLINLARGGVIDELALLKHLKNGARLRGAALDVHQEEGEGKISPLAELPNVILTPHIGAMTRDAQQEIGRTIESIVDTFTTTHDTCTQERAFATVVT